MLQTIVKNTLKPPREAIKQEEHQFTVTSKLFILILWVKGRGVKLLNYFNTNTNTYNFPLIISCWLSHTVLTLGQILLQY